jgi:glycosyltransferase involved in cell wall biosynthesis
MYISVIIPTYKRPQTLLQTLHSLQEQTLTDFEILVVDNAADPEIERRVTEFSQTAVVPALYVPEPRLGVHYARNTAAKIASGDLLLYTDDDMSFDPNWVAAYAKAFAEHPEMAAAGGPVRPVWEQPPPQWILDYMSNADCFPILSLMEPYGTFQLDKRGYFFSCNMAIWKSVLMARGGFHPEATGNVWLGDGETGLNRYMWAQGDLIGYVPESSAYHHIPPSRMTLEYFCHRMANEGACEMYARFHEEGIYWFDLLRYAASLVMRSSKSWIAASLLRGRTDPRSLQIQLNAARTQSRLKYVLRLMFDKEFQTLVLKKDWLNEPCASASFRS